MTARAADAVTTRSFSERSTAFARMLYPYRPRLRDRRFWTIQVLVALIALVHFTLESECVLEGTQGHIHSLFLVPISLFFVPVVYAALAFGLAGGLATAAWTTVLAVPNLMLFHEDRGLVSAVRRVLAELAERHHLEVLLEVPRAERRLAPDIELALFRIAQEALRNIEHHAQASLVRVTITFDVSEARLEVTDDGIGFTAHPAQDFAAAGRLGLLGTRERAEGLGGSLDLRSVPQRGTLISATIPTTLMTSSDRPIDAGDAD